ncbi:DNA-binding protein [Ralstonia solanacearum]|uniref:DNA-binding protein n=1 Tax=Ralstonia solanacearum TaxID=305 RepID=UPI000E57D05A|nr:DNA-binding protein [Ralstonia solanacearum]AXW25113.1 plasmid-related protein [Ralstonia solanacearum]
MSTMEEMLVSRYGVLLTLADCAALLNRSADGLRILLYKDFEISHKLRAAKVKIGKRTLFKANELARILDEA